MMCLDMGLFGFILFGILCASWTSVSFSFTRLEKFSIIIFSNRFSIPCSISSGTPMMQMLLLLMSSQKSLKLFSFLISFSALVGCFLLPCFPIRWFNTLLHLICCWFLLVYYSFQLLYSSFLTVFLWFICPFACCWSLPKFLNHCYKHCFELW